MKGEITVSREGKEEGVKDKIMELVKEDHNE